VRPLRIMVVDDSTSSRLMIKACLDGIERQVDEAENGEVAVTKFCLGSYDLVLMDIHMPQVDGLTATRRIRQWEREQHRQPTPIIALTALDHAQAAVRTRSAGCNDCVPKPVKEADAKEGRGLAQRLFGRSNKAADSAAQDNSALDALRPKFVAEKRREVDVLTMALQCGDFKTVRMLALRMKGEGANFGFSEVTQIGGELAAAADKMDPKEPASWRKDSHPASPSWNRVITRLPARRRFAGGRR
jgi:CheY-like chemotaxis protein